MVLAIHIGIHKTATTFLQKKFFPSLDRVMYLTREELGDFKKYILFEDDFSFSHEQALQIFKDCIARSNRVVGDKKCILISDEEFYANPFLGSIDRKRNIDRLIETFRSEFDVKILMFIRNQENLLTSLYLQYIKTGGTAIFSEFIRSRKYPLYFNVNYFLFCTYIKYLHDLVGMTNVNVLTYELFVRDKSRTCQEICSSLGLDQQNFTNGPGNEVINKSISSVFVRPMLFLNRITRSYKNPYALFGFGFYKIYSRVFIWLSSYFKFENSNMSYRFLESDEHKILKDNVELSQLYPSLSLKDFKYHK